MGVPSRSERWPTTADAVVVGGGTVGAWCAYFLRQSGVERVVLLERSTLGQGASSRAAGVVRSQGGTPTAVRLAEWSRAFYGRQAEDLPVDSGFVRQGYFLPCFTKSDVAAAHCRMTMQRAEGLAVRWVDSDEADALNPTLALGRTRGGTFFEEDGYIHPPRNVLSYTVALSISGVDTASGWRSRACGWRPGGSRGWRPMRDRSPPRRWS